MADPTNHNEAGEVAPSTVEQQAPSVSEAHAPSTESPQATDIPSANTPDPVVASPDVNPNAAEEKVAKKTSGKKATLESAKAQGGEQPAGVVPDQPKAAAGAAKAKKEKAPALEDKPFAEFIQQDYLPALQESLAKQGMQDLTLAFEQQKIPVVGFSQEPSCWQVIGHWNGGRRQFNVYFFKEDIQGQRAFSCADSGSKPSTLEPFLIDERKITLDLLVFGVNQRLTAQKWLVRN
jgi:Protein of unknown function (DUF2996)